MNGSMIGFGIEFRSLSDHSLCLFLSQKVKVSQEMAVKDENIFSEYSLHRRRTARSCKASAVGYLVGLHFVA